MFIIQIPGWGVWRVWIKMGFSYLSQSFTWPGAPSGAGDFENLGATTWVTDVSVSAKPFTSKRWHLRLPSTCLSTVIKGLYLTSAIKMWPKKLVIYREWLFSPSVIKIKPMQPDNFATSIPRHYTWQYQHVCNANSCLEFHRVCPHHSAGIRWMLVAAVCLTKNFLLDINT